MPADAIAEPARPKFLYAAKIPAIDAVTTKQAPIAMRNVLRSLSRVIILDAGRVTCFAAIGQVRIGISSVLAVFTFGMVTQVALAGHCYWPDWIGSDGTMGDGSA